MWVPRKDSVDTVVEAAGWLRRNPTLVPLFFVLGVVDALSEFALAFSAVAAVLGLYLGGVAHVFAREELAGFVPSLDVASSLVLDRFLSLLGVLVVYAALVFAGLVALVLPGLYLALRLSLSFPACVLDDLDAVTSLERSWEVAQGNLTKLLGVSLLGVAAVVVPGVVTMALVGTGDGFLLFSAAATAVVTPAVQMAYARVYLENRVDRSPPPEPEPRSGDWTADREAAQW